jgi:DNA-binding SARP family transcriptional activator
MTFPAAQHITLPARGELEVPLRQTAENISANGAGARLADWHAASCRATAHEDLANIDKGGSGGLTGLTGDARANGPMPRAGTWFGVLGSMHVLHEGVFVTVPAAKQRILLALLLVHPNQLLSVDTLADAIWAGVPPPGARATVRNYVKRLRQVLGPAGQRIVTSSPGYLVEVDGGELDMLLFANLIGQGSAAAGAGDWQGARERLGIALGLWRGTPLVDVPAPMLQCQEVPSLELMHMNATEWRVEADLHLGLHAELVPELQRLVTEQPLTERFHAQLMLSLFRSGRRKDALAAFQDARRILTDELGLEPAPELQELHRQILAGDPALAAPQRIRSLGVLAKPWVGSAASAPQAYASEGVRVKAWAVPRQLPGSVPQFVGRSGELKCLSRLAGDATTGPGAMVICVIGGTAGVGKSALAVHWAHEVADRFPDGQMYVNLRGFDASGRPVAPIEAIRRLLDALQVPNADIPPSLESQANLYRSLLSGRRVLIVLDNARDADQVRPLLPGSQGSMVLVTSRTQLTGLAAAEGAHLVDIDVLSDDEGRQLLERRLGPERIAADPQATAVLIQLCARLPLALSIAAAIAAGRPNLAVSALVAGLRDARKRLDALTTGEAVTDVRAVLSWSYRSLTCPAQRMFRLVGIHPGPDISLLVAASLAGVGVTEARRLLNELTRAHLLTELVPERFSFHDLLRRYADEQAGTIDTQACRHAAQHRMLDHYLHAAHHCALLLRPTRDSIVLTSPVPRVVPERPSGYGEALAWFQAEHSVLLAAIDLAEGSRLDVWAWQLPWAIAGFLDLRGHWHEWAATQRTALAAARRLGDVAGQAHAHRGRGCALSQLGAYEDARSHLGQAQRLYEESGDDAAHSRSCLNIAHTFERQHRYGEALAGAHRAFDLARSAADRPGQAAALNAMGWCNVQLKDYQRALAACQQALSLQQDLGDPIGEASAWDSVGCAHHQLGNHLRAVSCHTRAVRLFQDFNDTRWLAEALGHLGDAYHAAGSIGSAIDAWGQALAILEGLCHADAHHMRAKLDIVSIASQDTAL